MAGSWWAVGGKSPSFVGIQEKRHFTYIWLPSPSFAFLQRIEYQYHPAWGSIAEKTLYNNTGLERREVYTYDDEWGDLLKVETFGDSGARTRLVSYQYDTLGRTTAVSSPEGRIEYTYDNRGRLTGIRTSTGIETTYEYNAHGQLARVIDPALATETDINGTLEYTYNALGQKTKLTRPNGAETRWTYDTVTNDQNGITGWLKSIIHTDSSANNILALDYTRDMSGLITDVAEDRSGANDTYNWHYEYDNLKRLELAQQTAPDSSVLDYVYSYDRNGNRLSKSIGGTATNYTYNSLDQLLSESGASNKTYVWDATGRMTSDDDRTFEWSVDDRLLKVNIASPGAIISYSYDHLGTRVGRNAPGEDDPDTGFLTDYQNPTGYSQTLSEINSEQQPIHNYWWGSEHAPLAQSSLNPEVPNFDIAFFHGDNLGTTRALTSRAGLANSNSFYAYTPFGDIASPPGGSSLTNYYFTGQHRDAATDLQYHRARWLGVSLGRWLSKDKYFDFPKNSGHSYSYVNHSPNAYLDIQGLFSLGEIGISTKIQTGLSTIRSLTIASVMRFVGMKLVYSILPALSLRVFLSRLAVALAALAFLLYLKAKQLTPLAYELTRFSRNIAPYNAALSEKIDKTVRKISRDSSTAQSLATARVGVAFLLPIPFTATFINNAINMNEAVDSTVDYMNEALNGSYGAINVQFEFKQKSKPELLAKIGSLQIILADSVRLSNELLELSIEGNHQAIRSKGLELVNEMSKYGTVQATISTPQETIIISTGQEEISR